jgi:glycosyltransferase involved in cell wall biosynthesis
VNKNNAAGLEKTAQSVVTQTFSDFEYIIIDGGSDDGSVDVIKKYADKITYWVSEPDGGIYNAMNKGIKHAHGEFCLFLNSGDCLIETETLKNVFAEITGMRGGGGIDIYYSDLMKTDGSMVIYPKDLTIYSLLEQPISHQNALIKRELFLCHGMYNENYRIVSDYEFWLKEMWIYHTRFFHLDTRIALFDTGGVGSTTDYNQERRNMLYDVFIDLADPIRGFEGFIDLLDPIEGFKEFLNSVYYDIVAKYGNSRPLNVFLKIYRFFIKKWQLLQKKLRKMRDFWL